MRTACRTSTGWRTAWRPTPDDPYRGHSGPLVLERGPATNPLFEAFFKAGEEAGYPRTDDVNGYRQEGFAKFDRNIRNGRRLSAAQRLPASPVMRPAEPGPDHPGVRRPGWSSRASGRSVSSTGDSAPPNGSTPVRSSSAAALSTPRSCCSSSGVGNAADLQALGIDVVHDLPGVGENLQDHLEVYIQYACKQPVTMQPYLKWRYRPWIGANWLFLRRGPGGDEPLRGRRIRPQQRRRRRTRT